MIGKIEVPGCEEPSISRDGKYAYFPTLGVDFGAIPIHPKIVVIDTATHKIVKSVSQDTGLQSIYVTPNERIMVGKYYFDTSISGAPKLQRGKLAVYDAEMNAFLGKSEVEMLPLTIRSSFDGKIGFVANIGSGTVTLVDMESMTVLKTLKVDDKPNPTTKALQGAHGMVFFPGEV